MTETTAATVNAFLQHYDSPTPLGGFLRHSLEHLQLELGVPDCPLLYDFTVWGDLATECWVKSIWEKIHTLNIEVKIVYPTMKKPRERDKCIMQALLDANIDSTTWIACNKVRIHQEAMWLSCIADASGNGVETTYLQSWRESPEIEWGKRRSKLEFGRGWPTEDEWTKWNQAWRTYSLSARARFPLPLGKQINPSPRVWRVFFYENEDSVEILTDTAVQVYVATEGAGRTFRRSQDRQGEITNGGVPATISHTSDTTLKVTHTGRHWEPSPPAPIPFLEFLYEWGGTWMWRDLRGNTDPEWIRQALEKGTLICATDGSYDRKKAVNLSGAGWVIRCSDSKQMLSGALVERSQAAGSYRGELLGMLAIRLLLLAVEEYHNSYGDGTRIYCDNKSALFTFSSNKDRIASGSKHADIRRVLRTIRRRSRSNFLQQHVRAHQDIGRQRRHLSLEARLNCLCDDLAKGVVVDGLLNGLNETHQLPLESAWVIIDGQKQTSDVTRGLRYSIGMHRAREFYEKEGLLDKKVFDQIAWDDLDDFLSKKPPMYKLWYGKQGSGYCGTGKWLHRWDNLAEKRCPNCWNRCPTEDANHLNRCTDPGRTNLWRQHLGELEDWMENNWTQPSIQEMVIEFLKNRDRRPLAGTLRGIRGPAVHTAVSELDQIGWRNFTEGKVSKTLRLIQRCHLMGCPTRMTIEGWMKGLIGKLVSMTHAQWIYRNISKHHHEHGTKHLESREMILTEIEKMLEMGMQDLPQECACLLDIDPEDLYHWDMSQQQYWLQAMTAVRSAHKRPESLGDLQAGGKGGRTHTPYGELEVGTSAPDEIQSSHWRPAGEIRPGTKSSGTTTKPNKRRKTKTMQQISTPVTEQSLVQNTSRPHQPRDELAEERCHRDAKECDRIGLLIDPMIDANDMANLNRLFDPNRGNAELASKFQTSTVQCENFRRLNTTEWIDDETLNFMSVAYVDSSQEGIESYSSHFMSRLLNMNQIGDPAKKIRPWYPTNYQYKEVHRWHRRFDRGSGQGLFHLQHLFIPINVGQTHWIFLHVRPLAKTVHLYDSCGIDSDNQIYLTAIEKYLHQLYCALNRNGRHDFDRWRATREGQNHFESWRSTWEFSDASNNSPVQTDNFSCGVFTILSMYLLSCGHALSRYSYTQQLIYANKTRLKIAHLIWQKDERTELEARSNVRNWMLGLGPDTGRKPAAAPQAQPGKKKRKRTHSEKRVTIGGTKVARAEENTGRGESHVSGLLNRKRTAESVGERTDQDNEQQQLPRARKKKKRKKDIE